MIDRFASPVAGANQNGRRCINDRRYASGGSYSSSERKSMRMIVLTVSALLLAMANGCAQMNQAAPALAERYEVVAKYAIGGTGGWDFLSVDEKRHRLYVSRGDHVQVMDTRSGKIVGDLLGTTGVHGVALAEDLGLGFTSNGRSDSVTARRANNRIGFDHPSHLPTHCVVRAAVAANAGATKT